MKILLEKIYDYKNEGIITDYSLVLGGNKCSLVLTLKNNDTIEIMTKYRSDLYSMRKDAFFVKDLYPDGLLNQLKKILKRMG